MHRSRRSALGRITGDRDRVVKVPRRRGLKRYGYRFALAGRERRATTTGGDDKRCGGGADADGQRRISLVRYGERLRLGAKKRGRHSGERNGLRRDLEPRGCGSRISMLRGEGKCGQRNHDADSAERQQPVLLKQERSSLSLQAAPMTWRRARTAYSVQLLLPSYRK